MKKIVHGMCMGLGIAFAICLIFIMVNAIVVFAKSVEAPRKEGCSYHTSYFKDETGLCFFKQHPHGLAHVPCSKSVEAIIKKCK